MPAPIVDQTCTRTAESPYTPLIAAHAMGVDFVVDDSALLLVQRESQKIQIVKGIRRVTVLR